MNEKDWDRTAATFDEDVFNVPANDRQGLILRSIRRYAGKDKVTADLGCGIGRTVKMLASHFGTVHAVDFSGECLAVAERDHPGLSNVAYHHVDLAEEPIPFEAVDVVLCINAWLMHAPEKRAGMVQHVLDAVKPGGHLVLVTPALESALFATHRLVRWNLEQGHSPKVAQQKASRDMSAIDMGIVMIDGVATKHFLKEELEDVLTAQGLKVLDSHKLEYPWSRVFQDPPAWMGAPFPWNWLVVAERPA